MKLVRVGSAGDEYPAILIDDETALDASSLVADFGPGFFAGGGLERLEEESERRGGLTRRTLSGQRLGPPIARPHKLLCIGLNYTDHAAESGMEVPDEPMLFGKATNTIVGPNDDIYLPRNSSRVDFEVELAVVLGAEARYLPDEDAAGEVIAGYCLSHDVSERDFQLERGGQWIKGKSCETFNPLGPWFVTRDEFMEQRDHKLSLRLNGEIQQSSSTSAMIFSAEHIVWYLSQFMVLEPGDVINTGTPAGVGIGQDPPRYLGEGDVIELEITGLGRQRQVCRLAP